MSFALINVSYKLHEIKTVLKKLFNVVNLYILFIKFCQIGFNAIQYKLLHENHAFTSKVNIEIIY